MLKAMLDKLLAQTWLPDPWATRLRARVAQEHLTIAAWLRRLIIRELDSQEKP